MQRFESVSTRVEPWVTDREGKPVRGLTRDEFSVTEDGVPRTINFRTRRLRIVARDVVSGDVGSLLVPVARKR